MKIKKMRKGREWKPTADGMVLSCPICKSAWLTETEGYYDHGSCDHLRFIWWAGADSGDPDLHGHWERDRFVDQCLKELNRLLLEDDEDDEPECYNDLPGVYDSDLMRTILQCVDVPDVDEAWEYRFLQEFCSGGGADASGFFGVKR